MGEVQAMMGAGQPGLIRNDSLRAMMASWPNVLERYQEVEDEMRADVSDQFCCVYVLADVDAVLCKKQGVNGKSSTILGGASVSRPDVSDPMATTPRPAR